MGPERKHSLKMGWGKNVFLKMNNGMGPKNHGAKKKTFKNIYVSMGMGNGQGECELEKMMGLRRRWAREKMRMINFCVIPGGYEKHIHKVF
jgi:hypothetical protein